MHHLAWQLNYCTVGNFVLFQHQLFCLQATPDVKVTLPPVPSLFQITSSELKLKLNLGGGFLTFEAAVGNDFFPSPRLFNCWRILFVYPLQHLFLLLIPNTPYLKYCSAKQSLIFVLNTGGSPEPTRASFVRISWNSVSYLGTGGDAVRARVYFFHHVTFGNLSTFHLLQFIV